VSQGASVTLAIRPEHVKLDSSNGVPTLSGRVASKNYLGDAVLLEIEINGVTLMAKLTGETQLAVGDRAAVELPVDRWHVFP
jgi:ABC-type sugar transport system ATPase subunit